MLKKLFFKKQTGGGLISALGLNTWWEKELNREERELIRHAISSRISPLKLDSGANKVATNMRSTQLLTAILNNIEENKSNFDIKEKIASKLKQLVKQNPTYGLDEHFYISERIPQVYKNRLIEGLAPTIELCQEQILLSKRASEALMQMYPKADLPSHRGFKQLAIIYEKNADYLNAIAICKQAKDEGWMGDWDKRILRCEQKSSKKTH